MKNNQIKYKRVLNGAEVYLSDIPTFNIWPRPVTYPSDEYMTGLGYKRIYEEKPVLTENMGYSSFTDEEFSFHIKRTWSVQAILDDVAYLNKIKNEAKDIVAQRRWVKETGGLDLGGGVIVKTDRESQAALGNAYQSLKNNLITDTPWKGKNNVWTTLTLVEAEPTAAAVAVFVRGTFDQERAYHLGIDACTTVQAVRDYLEGAVF